jgi:hypothetical protein
MSGLPAVTNKANHSKRFPYNTNSTSPSVLQQETTTVLSLCLNTVSFLDSTSVGQWYNIGSPDLTGICSTLMPEFMLTKNHTVHILCIYIHTHTYTIAMCLAVLHVWCIIQNSAQTKDSLSCRTNSGQLFNFKNSAEWSALSLAPFPWRNSLQNKLNWKWVSLRGILGWWWREKYLPLSGIELDGWVHGQSIYRLNYFSST